MNNRVKLYKGDCLEIMKDIADESIDLVITSPPYNANKDYGEYNDNKTIEEYKEFAEKWVCEVSRILKPNGSFWINLGYIKSGNNQTIPLTYIYYSLIDIPLIQEIVWHYEGGMSYKKRFTHRTERWQWYCKNPKKVIFNLDDVRDITLNRTKDKRNNPLGKNPTDYWYYDRVVSGNGKCKEKTLHPCQFPTKMIERIIKACSNENNIILDCFMGSGSTGIACLNTNRKFIGIEQDDKYFDIAKDRINQTLEENKQK